MAFSTMPCLMISILVLICLHNCVAFSSNVCLHNGKATSLSLKGRIPQSAYSSQSRSKKSICFAYTDETDTKTEKRFFPLVKPKEGSKNIMADQVDLMEGSKVEDQSSAYVTNERDGMSPELMGAGAIAAAVAIIGGLSVAHTNDVSPTDLVGTIQNVFNDPTATFNNVLEAVETMGPLAPLYFGAVYTIAEVLAIPAIPLTASAGYLFGPVQGTGVVLVSASIAAAISFVIGRTLLRDYVERVLDEYPRFAKIDRAIGKEGFKLMFLLRLSPIFPFALSNYLYGASSINFSAFFWGTLLGFAPGTVAYVYTGYIGKALTTDGAEAFPWYVYAGGMVLFGGILKLLADTATSVIEELEDEDAAAAQ